MLQLRFLLFYFSLKLTHCFNIDTNYPIVYKHPSKYPFGNRSTYFGYSVALYPGSKSEKPWILIGAPRSLDSYNQNSGACFKCGIGEECEILNLKGPQRYINDAWIGGSMDINYKFGRVVTCAPRWIKVKSNGNRVTDYLMRGACFWFHANDTNVTHRLEPLQNNDIYQYPHSNSGVYHYAQGETGLSAHLPKDENRLLLGAPGVHNWHGTSILYEDENPQTPIASRYSLRRGLRDVDTNEFTSFFIGDPITTTQTVAFDLLGYSSTSGHFYSRSELFYVSGAPRSDYIGRVLIYRFKKNYKDRVSFLEVRDNKGGQQLGEYFGASLTAGDVNNDGLDDLIVGAPFHRTKNYNEGKVYVFLGSRSGLRQAPEKDSIVGKAQNGQFGTTLQYLGDLNHDGYGDVAVAAPYEENKSGVVYIFRGTNTGLNPNYCQRIVGKDIYPTIKGFGMSISKAVDLDYNNYPDVAIGAHLSSHVAFLRTRPVVTILQELKSSVSHLLFNDKRFTISVCLWYHLDQLEPGEIFVNRTLTIDQQLGRAFLRSGGYSEVVELKERSRLCQNFTVDLIEGVSNHYDPIEVSLSFDFINNEQAKEVIYVDNGKTGIDRFCHRCPVYNKYGSDKESIRVPFALGCKSNNICKASLQMKPRIRGLGEDNIFVLGSQNYLTLDIEVENSGEKAYLTQVLLTLPEVVSFRSTPSACTEQNSSSVACSVDNPLEPNSKKVVSLDLDMSSVNVGKDDGSLVFTIEVTTSSENDKPSVQTFELKLQREADVTITGKSREQSYSLRNLTTTEANFTQIYQIETFGSSPLNEILVEISIPHVFQKTDEKLFITELYLPRGILGGQEVSCVSNFTYLSEEGFSSDNGIDYLEENSTTILKRSVRQVQSFDKNSNGKDLEFEAFQNRTFYVNCSSKEVVCSKVLCRAGPFRPRHVFTIELKMRFNMTVIKDFLGKNEFILFGTKGRVSVTNPQNFMQSGDKPDTVEVTSLFIKESKKEVVALWIIILAAIAGLILLLLLIFALVKLGFFKRTTKEELDQLKKEMELEDDAGNFNESEEIL